MLNLSALREAIEALKKSVARHQRARKRTTGASERLFRQRRHAASDVIKRVEQYVNLLASSPKEFDKIVEEYRIAANRFNQNVRVKRLEIAAARSKNMGSATETAGAIAGVGVGVSVAALGPSLGPSAALAVATTFGTASTGTAISALSGAAAMNAALAWLGGGALAAGGGGMAAGNALLALAGPVAWTVAGVAIVGSATYLHVRNRKRAQEAREKRVAVEAEIRSLEAAGREIRRLTERTEEHADGCISDLRWLRENASANYREFSDSQKERLAALINHIRSLVKLLRAQVAYETS